MLNQHSINVVYGKRSFVLLHDEYVAYHEKIDNEDDIEKDSEEENKEWNDVNEDMKVVDDDDDDSRENNVSTLDGTMTTHQSNLESFDGGVAMKEDKKEGYIVVNKSQTLSSDENNLQSYKKKPKYDSESPAVLEKEGNTLSINSSLVEQSQKDIEMKSVDDSDDKTIVRDTISRVSSFSELKVEDIGALLHGDHRNNSYSALPKKGNGYNKDQKLVGGRVATSDHSGTSFDFKMAIDEKLYESDEGDEQQKSDKAAEDDAQSQHEQPDSSLVSQEKKKIPTPIDLYFTMEVQTCLTCNSCSFSRSRKETFRHLSLEIGDFDDNDDGKNANTLKKCTSISSTISSMSQQHYERTIQEGLRNFFSSEKLELKCEKCFGECATQSMEIKRLPKVLILHLKRFIVDVSPDYTSVNYRKNRSAVEFGDNLTLDIDNNETGALGEFLAGNVRYPSIPKQEKQNDRAEDNEGFEILNPYSEFESEDDNDFIDLGLMQKSFHLRSVVNHIGKSANCGHYTANVSKLQDEVNEEVTQSGEEKRKWNWMKFNDDYVSILKDEDAISGDVQKNAYMLLYEFE